MSRSDGFSGLSEFLAVARHASFRAAAAELGVTPAAVSQAIRTLEVEDRTGAVPTHDAARGSDRSRRKPARARATGRSGNRRAFDALTDLRERPGRTAAAVGAARRGAARDRAGARRLSSRVPRRRSRHRRERWQRSISRPTISMPASASARGRARHDRCASDAGSALVGARRAGVLRARGRPRTPEELTRHECIRYRFLTAGSIYRWEFERGGRDFSVDVPGGVTVNDSALMMSFAAQGNGADLHGGLCSPPAKSPPASWSRCWKNSCRRRRGCSCISRRARRPSRNCARSLIC